MKIHKTILATLFLLALASSCSQIEKATEKWKTPETPAAPAIVATPTPTPSPSPKASASSKTKKKKKKKTTTK